MEKTFNISEGVPGAYTSRPVPYEQRFIKSGVTMVLHEHCGKYQVSEWYTGRHMFTMHDLKVGEVFGLDIITEAEAEKFVAKHGVEKINRFVGIHKEINS